MDAILTYKNIEDDCFYNILGCDETSSTEQIMAEYKVRVLQCHPDKHRDDENADEKFACLQQAKETLCDAQMRKDYDTWRNSGLAITYADWRARRDAMHSSMHWAVKTKKEPMLEDTPAAPSTSKCSSPGTSTSDSWSKPTENQWVTSQWQSWTPSDNVRKFRNYEI